MQRATLVSLLLAVAPALVGAQTKDQMIADWTRHRALVLAYVDAMPDSAIAFQPIPAAPSFASQIDLIASTSLELASQALRGVSVPFVADTAQTLHQKAALHAHVARTYDYVLEALRGATPAQLARIVTMLNNSKSAARWLATAQEHAMWMLGTTVPYLLLNGVTPPEYVAMM